MSDQSLLSTAECESAVTYAEAHASEWMTALGEAVPISYMSFGGDTNFEGSSSPGVLDDIFAPAGTPWMPHYNFRYGFKKWMGRATGFSLDNATHVRHVRGLVRDGLATQLANVRRGLARHLGV